MSSEQDLLAFLRRSAVPVTTREVEAHLGVTRSRAITLLNRMAIERKIRGKQVRNRGEWVWWVD
jgi:hypothetical protein